MVENSFKNYRSEFVPDVPLPLNVSFFIKTNYPAKG